MSSGFKRFAIATVSTVLAIASAFWIPNSTVATLIAIGAIFIGFPVSILTYRDAVQAASMAGSKPVTTVLAIPIRLLGAISLLIGVAIFVWLGYNLLIERQLQFIEPKTYGQVVVPFILIVFGYRLLRRPIEKEDDREAA